MIIINGHSLFIGNKTKSDSWKINDSIINKAMRLMTTFLRTRFPLENLFQINSIQMAIILTTRDQSRKRVKNPQKYKSSRDHLKWERVFIYFLHIVMNTTVIYFFTIANWDSTLPSQKLSNFFITLKNAHCHAQYTYSLQGSPFI